MIPDKLEQLLHESECTYLDFKRAQYPFQGASDQAKSELLKDILAIANADKQGDGYILIGVEEVRGSRSRVHGVNVHPSDNDLQQFVSTKLNRPLRFSYEVVPCDGVTIGVIHIPAQDRFFYLKNDYGKLEANIAYYRLGSSTAQATPDELFRWGKASAAQNAGPCLEIQFAYIKRPTAVGGNKVTKEAGTDVRCKIRQAHQVIGEDLARLCPPQSQPSFTREAEYWTGFARFFRTGLRFTPIGLALRNTGRVTATDIRVELVPDPGSKLTILSEDKVSMRPLHSSKFPHGGMFASYTRFGMRDIELQEEAGLQKILWSIPKALPHLVAFSEEMFYVTASETGSFPLHCTIFAENLPQPARTTLTIHLETEAKEMTIEEIAAFSEVCTSDDIQSGRGNLAI
jgi:hypothetical protein